MSSDSSRHLGPGEYMDISGQQFEDLTAIEYYGRDGSGKTWWLCRCECGRTKVCDISNVKSGFTSSCGHRRAFMCQSKFEGVPCCKRRGHAGPCTRRIRDGLIVEWTEAR
jgi:hypothetical protein